MENEYINALLKYDSAWKGHGKFAMKLVEIFKPNIIVDLGVDYGFSTFCFAYHKIGSIYGIDWFQGDLHAGFRDTLEDVEHLYNELTTMWGIDNIKFIKSDFKDASDNWEMSSKIDILHIDGFHSYEAVSSDYYNWIRHCNEDAIILFHDVESYMDTVGKFFAELNGYKIIHTGSAGLGVLTKSQEKIIRIQEITL